VSAPRRKYPLSGVRTRTRNSTPKCSIRVTAIPNSVDFFVGLPWIGADNTTATVFPGTNEVKTVNGGWYDLTSNQSYRAEDGHLSVRDWVRSWTGGIP
jgi:hypothetical protein